MHEPHRHLTGHPGVEKIFDCSEPEHVLRLLNEFLVDFASWRPAGDIAALLCPPHIHTLESLEDWLIPVRIETQRQEAHAILSRSGLFLLKGMLDAASRQLQVLMRR